MRQGKTMSLDMQEELKKLIMSDMKNSEIATKLGISESTVTNYKKRYRDQACKSKIIEAEKETEKKKRTIGGFVIRNGRWDFATDNL